MAAAPSRETIAALIDYEFATWRVEAVKNRVIREGLTREASNAWIDAQGEQTLALCALDRALRADQDALVRSVVDEAVRAAQ